MGGLAMSIDGEVLGTMATSSRACTRPARVRRTSRRTARATPAVPNSVRVRSSAAAQVHTPRKVSRRSPGEGDAEFRPLPTSAMSAKQLTTKLKQSRSTQAERLTAEPVFLLGTRCTVKKIRLYGYPGSAPASSEFRRHVNLAAITPTTAGPEPRRRRHALYEPPHNPHPCRFMPGRSRPHGGCRPRRTTHCGCDATRIFQLRQFEYGDRHFREMLRRFRWNRSDSAGNE